MQHLHYSRRAIAISGITALLLVLTLVLLQNGLLLSVPYSQFTYPLDINFQSLLEDLQNGGNKQHLLQPINVNAFKILHFNQHRCSNNTKLLIMVKSSSCNYKNRMVIRSTWASSKTKAAAGSGDVQHVFVIGANQNKDLQRQVDNEQVRYGDLIQQNFTDSYFNNTYKLMFMFDWAAEYCKQAKFVLFADDDYYIGLTNLLRLIETEPPNRDTVIGHVFRYPMPKRIFFSKWYTSLSEYPFTFWPPYPTGGAMLISGQLCRKLSLVQNYIQYLRFDDVFLGILLKKLHVMPRDDSRFLLSAPNHAENSQFSEIIAVHLDKDLRLLLRIWHYWHDSSINEDSLNQFHNHC